MNQHIIRTFGSLQPSVRLGTASRRVLSLMLGAAAIALVTWLGSAIHFAATPEVANHVRLDDTTRGWMFEADPQSGEVRVIRYRGGIAELARLRPATPRHVNSLSLDAAAGTLIVASDHGNEIYGLHDFRVRKPATRQSSSVMAQAGAPRMAD